MIKTVKLTLAERYFAGQVMSSGMKFDFGTARAVRDTKQSLQIRAANKLIQEKAEDASDDKKGFDWDDIVELDPNKAEYTCEESSLKTLIDMLTAHDPTKRKTQQGQDITIPVSADLLEIIANLADALSEAISKPVEK